MARKSDRGETDPKIAARRATLARQRRRRRFRVIRIVMILAAVLVLAGLITRSRPLSVQNVSVSGVERVSGAAVIDAADVAGVPLVSVNGATVAGQVKTIPQILDADVRTDYLRRRVHINVVERIPIAVIGGPSSYLVIDREGVAMDTTATPSPGLFYLTGEIAPGGVGQASVAAGRAASSAAEISAWTKIPIRAAGSSARGIFLVLADGSYVHLGSADRMEEKGRALRAIQAKAEAERWKAAVYELSSPETPAVERSPT